MTTNNCPKVKCPTCNKDVLWSTDNKFRPFCCERCKLIDLGEWASEKHSIAGSQVNPELANFDEFALPDNNNFFNSND